MRDNSPFLLFLQSFDSSIARHLTTFKIHCKDKSDKTERPRPKHALIKKSPFKSHIIDMIFQGWPVHCKRHNRKVLNTLTTFLPADNFDSPLSISLVSGVNQCRSAGLFAGQSAPFFQSRKGFMCQGAA